MAALERRGRKLATPASLAADLGVGRGASKKLRALLRGLESEGRVERIRGRYRAVRSAALHEGVYAPEGRAGVVVDDTRRTWRVGRHHDAEPGDRVAIQPWGDPGAQRADVLHVVEGARRDWVGIYHQRGKLAFATPYRDDGEWMLRIARDDTGGAREGEVVRLEPAEGRGRGGRARRSGEDEAPWARVVARLGRPGDADADFAAVAWRHRLPGDFAPEVLAEAQAAAEEPLDAEIARRVDLRGLPFVTIDPPSARDHDDAIAVEALPDGGTLLRVAIADVAHYVPLGGRVDREALRRGTSVYFPDRALPMLPPALSSDACSLRPETDRLAMVAELVFDAEGRRLREGCYPAVVRSRAHLPYDRAAAVMAGEADHPLAADLQRLDRLAERLCRRRAASGALALDLGEGGLELDAEGRVAAVVERRQGVAHRAVEESMLAANGAVARLLREARTPAVYRNHEAPAPDDADALQRVLVRLGLHGPAPISVRSLAAAVRETPEELTPVVHPIVLRAMRQARYGAECAGHFALATDAYLHFTSPIRRYPDLVVHRALKALLAGGDDPYDAVRVQRIAARCSFRERLAERAERERVLLGKCAFLTAHVGEEHEGTITGVARHGAYVGLDPWPIEGLVHVSRLPDFVSLDEDELSLVADGSRRRYALGDRLLVRIAAVDVVKARIDLEIVRVLEPSPLFGRRNR
ncbi:MAG: ribonuclease R family protein [Myxococcota bacterium]